MGQNAKGKQRGVYLREPHEAAHASAHTCFVSPKLHEDAENGAKLEVT